MISQEDNENTSDISPETITVHACLPNMEQARNGDVVMPQSLSTAFVREDPKVDGFFAYTRFRNPNRHAFESQIAMIEGAKYGLAFSSGMSAINSVYHALLKSGDHVLLGLNCYNETAVIARYYNKFGITASFVWAESAEDWASALLPGVTKIVFIESPSNPQLAIIDIAAVCKVVKAIDKEIVIVLDNTIMTGYLQQPLTLGVDVVTLSISKYINGSNDVMMGAVCTNSEDLFNQIQAVQLGTGCIPSPSDCYQALKGLTTLPLRMQKHCENAMSIAEWLLTQTEKVRHVMYHGLKSHKGHEIASRQSPKGFSGIVSFYITSSDPEAASKFVIALKLFQNASTFGGGISMSDLPLFSSSRLHDKETLARLGINHALIRLAVGIECVDDLIADLKQGFDQIAT